MRIIVVGGAGTIGKAAVKALSDRHEVVVAGRRSGTVHVDIRSPDSVRAMYQQVGRFDALVCAAGDAHLGPFESMSEAEFVLGIEIGARTWDHLWPTGASAPTPREGSASLTASAIYQPWSPRAARNQRTTSRMAMLRFRPRATV